MISIGLYERMSDELEKFHIAGLPFSAVIHRFTGEDKGDPHDHPFGFWTHILGDDGYTEKVYWVNDDGTWDYQLYHRTGNTSHYVPANCIHQLIELDAPEVITIILPEDKVAKRKTHFWRFEDDDKVSWRAFDEPEFKPYKIK